MSALRETAEAAIEDANARRRNRRNDAAQLAAETRSLRREHAISRIAAQMITGRELGGVVARYADARSSIRPRSDAASEAFDPENVQNFVTFLRGCGGFSIW